MHDAKLFRDSPIKYHPVKMLAYEISAPLVAVVVYVDVVVAFFEDVFTHNIHCVAGVTTGWRRSRRWLK